MALIIKDRVKEITTTTGTGAVSLGGASATFDAFQSVMSNGDTTFYAIVHTTSGVDQWEVGIGTWNTGNTLTRNTIISGSSNTSAVNFSSGTKDIFMTYPASKTAVAGEDITFADVTATDITSTGTVTLSADPSSALQAATKQYVDTIAAAGIHYHTPVRVEHPSNLNATYNNGSSGVGATLTNAGTNVALVLDNVSMGLNDRVLVANQTDQTQNGVYTVTTVGDGSTAWVLTRSTDTDTAGPSDPDAFGKGDAFFIKEGDTNAGHLDVLTTTGTIVFGTTNIVFSEVAETSIYAAGAGLSLTGTTFAVDLSYLDNRYFTESEADSRFVNVSGDTMTGALDVQSTITADGLTVDASGTPASLNRTDGNAALLELKTSGSVRGYIGADTTGSTVFYSGAAAERMRIDSSGNTIIKAGKELRLNRPDDATYGAISHGASGTGIVYNDVNGDGHHWQFAGSEKMRIDSIGDLTVKGGRIFVNESDNGNTAIGLTRDADEGYVQVYSAGSITTSIRGNGDSYFNGGNIGIGTSAGFGGKLDITLSTNARGYFSDSVSEVGSGNFALQVVNSAGSALKPLGFRAEDIRFATGSSERMTIDSAGTLILKRGTADAFLNPTGSALEMDVNRNPETGAFDDAGKSHARIRMDGAAGGSKITFHTASANNTVATERMRLDGSGHVAVGRTAPVSGLASYTQFTVSGPEGGISINSTDTTTGDYSRLMFTKSGSTGNEGLIRYNTGNYHMSFWTNATERMRIDSSGLVDIGSNSTASAGASKQLLSLVNPSGTANTAARLWMSGTNSTSRGTYIEAEAQSTGNDHDLIFATSASGSAPSERMRIDSSGNLLVSKNTTSVATAGVAISSSQGVRSTVDGNVPVLLNRLSDDGNLIDFRKDGTVVGVIGTSGGDLLIRSSATSHGGLRFGEGYIFPVNNNGATSDGAIDLGISSSVGRFRNLFLSGAVNAAQFYDINNTSYYLDPAATGTALNVNGTIAINNGGSSNTHGLKFTGSNSRIWFHGYRTLEGSTDGNNLQVGEGFSYTTILNQTRSPIFYDSDNTAYFINPSATNDSAKFRQHVSIGDGSASANSGSWGARLNLTDQVHSRIDVQQDANSMIGTMYVHTGHAGPRIGSSTAHPMYMMYNGGGVGFWDTNQLKHDSSVRAPVFYDSNDTAYYTDPASTSLLSDLRVGGGRTGRTFTLANTGSASKWIKLGNFAAAQDGRSVFINVVTNSGYNASDAQNSQVEIRFKTSNNSTNQSGFYGDVQAYKTGPNATPSVVRVVQQSTTSFDIWCSFGTFTGGGSFYTVYQDAGTWTHSGTTTTTAPTGTYVDAAIRTMWHSGNDGSGSGLDADLLDGVHGSSFGRTDSGVPDFQYGIQAGELYLGTDGDTDGDYNLTLKATGNNTLYLNHGGTGHIDSLNAIYAPQFYDRDNSAYYVDPATYSKVNALLVGNQTTHNAGTSYGIQVHHNNRYLASFRYSGVGGNYPWIVHDTYNSTGAFIIHFNGIGDKFQFTQAGDGFAASSLRAPIFYDSNDTAYYLDPASTSDSALRVRGGALFGGNTTWGDFLMVGGDGRQNYINNTTTASVATTDGNLHLDAASGHDTYINYYDGNNVFFGSGSNTQVGRVTNAGVAQFNSFTDNNNTAYYVDPASDSKLNNLDTYNYVTVGGGANAASNNPYSSVSSTRLMFGSRDSNAQGAYFIGTNMENYGGNYTKLDLRWHTGIRMGAQQSYGGVRIFDSEGLGTVLFAVAQGDTHVRATNNFYAKSFYDIDNTAYYVDPASTSNLVRTDIQELNVNGGTRNNTNDATVYITATNNNDWGLIVNKYNSSASEYGVDIRMGSSFNYGLRVLSAGSTKFIVDTNKAQHNSSVRAPIFYDSNNTSYYFDGAATGDSIRCAGDIVAYYSDERLKDIEGNIDTPLEKVSKLNGFYYVANKKARELGYKADRQVGVSAQEVEAVMPEIVKDAAIGHGYKTVDYGKLVPLLIEAVKEQQKLIEELYKKFDEID